MKPKFLLTTASIILVFSQLCLAQANQHSTQIYINPVVPANCEIEDHPKLNRINHIKTVSEDALEVTFQFTVQVGYCSEGEFIKTLLNSDIAVVALLKENFSFFGRKMFKLQKTAISDTEILIQMSFDKKLVFKLNKRREKQMSERLFVMYFQPRGPYFETYKWYVMLERGADDSTIMNIVSE